jgi:hypothetical protein
MQFQRKHLLTAWENGGSSACEVRRRQQPGSACRQQLGGSCAIGQGGNGLAPRLAGPVAERRDPHVAMCLVGPQPRATSGRAGWLVVECRLWERNRAPCVGAKRSGARRAGVDFVFLDERRMLQ